MLERQKIVEFGDWCKRCKHWEKTEADDPCWDCLADPVNYATHKPTRFEEADNGENS